VPSADAGFPKQYRLLQRSDYTRLASSSTLLSGRSFLVVWQQNAVGHPRIGITASKKAGTAVVRNRIKRCVREYFRQHRKTLPDVDFNVIVRRQAAEKTTALLFLELQRVFHQIGSRACCHEFS